MTATLQASPELQAVLANDLVRDAAGRIDKLLVTIEAIPREGSRRDLRLTEAAGELVMARTALLCWQLEGGE